MAISVTIADGEVYVCVCVPTERGVEEMSGPFTDIDTARKCLAQHTASNADCYAEAERLWNCGVPFFISTVGAEDASVGNPEPSPYQYCPKRNAQRNAVYED